MTEEGRDLGGFYGIKFVRPVGPAFLFSSVPIKHSKLVAKHNTRLLRNMGRYSQSTWQPAQWKCHERDPPAGLAQMNPLAGAAA